MVDVQFYSDLSRGQARSMERGYFKVAHNSFVVLSKTKILMVPYYQSLSLDAPPKVYPLPPPQLDLLGCFRGVG